MAELVPANAPSPVGHAGASPLPAMSGTGAGPLERLRSLTAQPAIRRSLPALGALAGVVAAALLWVLLTEPPQRVLYSSLSDSDRAEVVASLDAAGVAYAIDNASGALSVAEDDLYRARMLVASDGALAAPEDGAAMLDAIPLGSSRVLEGERVRRARERELMLTIVEIDGVESARVHLATPDRSVFVRDQAAPSASVMVRLARGRSLSLDQARAIADLVAASVPGLAADAVRIVDQNGRLLRAQDASAGKGLELQAAYEAKLRAQVAQLLLPMVGDGGFSVEAQVALDPAEVTRAQEAYDRDGVLRTEAQSQSQQTGGGPAIGVPGVLSNTPPPATTVDPAAPAGSPPAAPAAATSGESSAERTFAHGRQVSVSTTAPGSIRRVSVAVALSADALKRIRPATVEQVERLVAAAAGIDPSRGDTVTVVAGAFEQPAVDATPFYEAAWFPSLLRYAAALLAVALVLILAVRPLLRTVRKPEPANGTAAAELAGPTIPLMASNSESADGTAADRPALSREIEAVRKLAAERPDHAAAALRRLLVAPAATAP